jgi:thiamine biosynthesis lipoprotein
MKSRVNAVAAAVLAAVSCCAACSNRSDAAESSRTEWAVGTWCSIRIADGLRGAAAERAIDAAFARLREIEDRLSANKDGTDIDRANRAAGGAAIAVSDDTVFVLGKALEYAALTGGAFDPSVGPLVKLWGIGTDAARLPSQAEIDPGGLAQGRARPGSQDPSPGGGRHATRLGRHRQGLRG